MKWNKELLAIISSLLLLGLLIINWGYNVYQNKIAAIQAESNVIFFQALENAKDEMMLRKTVKPTLIQSKDGVTIWNFQNIKTDRDSGFINNNEDTFSENKFLDIFYHTESENSFSKSYHELEARVDSAKLDLNVLYHAILDSLDMEEGTKVSGLEVKMSDDNGEFYLSQDTIVVVDFDTTQSYLERIFLEKMDTANLSKLEIEVYDIEASKAPTGNAIFTTNSGKLGVDFFGRKTYAATIQNFGFIALRDMIPELIFGIFLYGLIATAFFVIYKNLITQRKLVRVKDEFVGNITHELKTPISVVNVAIEAIQNFDAGKDPEKTKRYLDISKKELNRLSGLVDKVLHLSVNPSDDAPRELIDIIELTTQVVDSMHVRLSDAPITIQINTIDETILLDANISQVKSVIYNLIENAIKYSDKGQVLVSIDKPYKSHMYITIADEGIGIAKEFQDRIFDQFFRVPSDNVHNVKGYGLGLYNVKQIVEQYDGTINVKSEESVGTTFTIKWPIHNG